MASKKDLVEGQAFSRRRLVTAFVSGAPGGREVEPGKPLRAVVGGIVLSAVLVVGALAAGLLSPTLPSGWDNDSLVIAKDTGARYVALGGVLYPVINTTSARLLIPSGFTVVSADSDRLTGARRGPTLGIIGAPDALPGPAALIGTGWSACTSRHDGVRTTISRHSGASPVSDQAVVATVGPTTFLVDNGVRYRIPEADVAAVLRVLQLDTAPVLAVDAGWINLFTAGPDLGPLTVPGAGTPLAGVAGLPAGAEVGSVVSAAVTGTGGRRYVLEQGGRVSPLSDLAYAMYRLGSGAGQGGVLPLDPAQLGALQAGAPAAPPAWPGIVPAPVTATPCAVLKAGTGGTRPAVALGTRPGSAPADGVRSTTVDAGAGALVRAIGAASLTSGPVFLVDQTGTAFPVASSGSDDPVRQLGYTPTDITPVPQAWIALLGQGPTLSVAAAHTAIAAAGGR